jgi:hypothetical protein
MNGRVYTELEISLPRELTQEQREELVSQFVEKTLGKNFTYSYAIHNPLARDGEQNPHVHLMFSERKLDGIDRDEAQHFKRYNSKILNWAEQVKTDILMLEILFLRFV